jgi:hypothetical protein
MKCKWKCGKLLTQKIKGERKDTDEVYDTWLCHKCFEEWEGILENNL